jgi:hypothetical protein
MSGSLDPGDSKASSWMLEVEIAMGVFRAERGQSIVSGNVGAKLRDKSFLNYVNMANCWLPVG